jgi:hypothetical protein
VVRKTVTDRPDLCEFSRLHAEYGGKNECRFMAQFFKPRRAELLRILTRLRFVGTSHDTGFERSLALMLSQRERRGEWIALKAGKDTYLSLQDLEWVPEKWWKLITGESQRESPTRIHRRQFEVCVCAQMIREFKSGDLCVIGADAYSDCREQMVSLEECARTRAAYGDEVGLPVAGNAFVQHVRGLLVDATKRADDSYPENAFFKIVNGRPKLGRQTAKTTPAGFEQLDQALTRKLDALGLSLLDVLARRNGSTWTGISVRLADSTASSVSRHGARF